MNMPDLGIRSGKTRDSEKTREAILDAAEAVFAQHGFAGARTEAIATASGYNTSLIFRYFGGKVGLYSEVLKRADAEVNKVLTHLYTPFLEDKAIAANAFKFRQFLEKMVQALFDYLLEHPQITRILSWEMANGWQLLRQITTEVSTEDTERFETLFNEAKTAGSLRSDFVPQIQQSLIVQICQIYLVSLPLYQRLIPEENLSSDSAIARARDFLVEFVVNGMMDLK